MCSRYTLRAKSAAIAEEFDLPQKTLERCARVREAGSVLRLKPRGLSAMGQRHRLIILGCALLLGLILPVVHYLSHNDVAHQAIRIWLEHFGSSIYEYHSKTGKWPSQTADLAKTSLPQQFRYWKQVLDDETIVVVWHKNLKADPKDNAGLILAYHNKGLYARLGRVWVCWGDLRTEYIKVEDLRANLQTNKD